MTFLPSQATRDALNIDTLERAIAFSAPLLTAANQDPLNAFVGTEHPYFSAVELAIEQDKLLSGLLRIRAGIPINKSQLLQSNLNILDAVLAFSPYVNLFNFSAPAPSSASTITQEYFNMPATPSNVDTLEKYFVWASLLWKQSIGLTAQNAAPSFWNVSYGGSGGGGGSSFTSSQMAPANPIEGKGYSRDAQILLNLNGDYPSLKIELTLPFLMSPLIIDKNLLEAIIAVGEYAP